MAPRVRGPVQRDTRAARPRPAHCATDQRLRVRLDPARCLYSCARVSRAKALCSQRRESRGTISRRHMRRHASSSEGVRQGVRRPRGGTLALHNRCKLAADGSHSSWQLHRWALQPWRREAATRAHGCERVDWQGHMHPGQPAAATGQPPDPTARRQHTHAPIGGIVQERWHRERERVAALERLSLGGSSSAA